MEKIKIITKEEFKNPDITEQEKELIKKTVRFLTKIYLEKEQKYMDNPVLPGGGTEC